MKEVEVVAFILEKDGKILVEKRKKDKETDPGKKAIPAGHVEIGESLEQACIREMKEELDLKCKKIKFVCKLLHHTKIEDQMTHYFFCSGWKGEPRCLEAKKLIWINPEDTKNFDLEVDKKAVRRFIERKSQGEV